MNDSEISSGINAAMTAALAEQFALDPESVDDTWRDHFETLDHDALCDLLTPEAARVYEARTATINGASAAQAAAGWQVAEQLRIEWAVRDMVEAYRRDGHLHANSNPLEATGAAPHIDLNAFGISSADFGRQARSDVKLGEGATVADIIGVLESTYCASIGPEISHVEGRAARRWLIDRMESCRSKAPLDDDKRGWILRRLTDATLLEQFVHRKFVGAKRFSLEGGESLIPMLSTLVNTSGDLGVKQIILGMAHRGRLNVMVNIFNKQVDDLFMKFHDKDAMSYLGGGDVKYHHGLSHDVVTPSGNSVHLSMCFNPSHLEFVNPVVLGRARAKQDRIGDAEGQTVLPVLIHGDSAVVGQGVVAETFNLMSLRGYSTGGTVHIVINNQIGFTTEPHDSRTTRYCTDIAKWFNIPVLHVNGDDPESAVLAAMVASEFRQKFGKDVIIDLVCYRRHGHNEGDEPRFTQPQMYGVIDKHKPIRDLYASKLSASGILSVEQDEAIVKEWTERSEEALRKSMQRTNQPRIPSMAGCWKEFVGGRDSQAPLVDTSFPEDLLKAHIEAICEVPEGFTVARKLKRFLQNRREMAQGTRPLDWGAAEALAFSSLVAGGVPVRLSGQDGQRGTFSHRHAVMTDPTSGERWAPIKGLCTSGATFRAYNSPLSEASVMGFDWGYSLDRPESLTIWEAQFGDFANSAQVIIDQFVASSEDKWNRLSGLVLLLPHGYAGQGPEHSSARMERFLQMTAEDNIQVCNPTTPAQIFHLLRRQVLRKFRKPLVVMSPKSLLRHKKAKSSLEELSSGGFKRIIPDQSDVDPEKVKRVLLCSGRVYYDLDETRTSEGHENVAILRFEQLYPLSDELIIESLQVYKNAAFFWVQDEPWNHGPWQYIQARIRLTLGYDFPLKVVSRAPSASPATGSKASHDFEARRLLDVAFGKLDRDETGSVCINDV
jgi:2-oxoglutarate dehydrogenase E1 component